MVSFFTISFLSLLSPSHRVVFREAGISRLPVLPNDSALNRVLNARASRGETRGRMGSQPVTLAAQPRKLQPSHRFQVLKGNGFPALLACPFWEGNCAEPLPGRSEGSHRSCAGQQGCVRSRSKEQRQERLDPLGVSPLVFITPWKNTFWNRIGLPYFRDVKVSTMLWGM